VGAGDLGIYLAIMRQLGLEHSLLPLLSEVSATEGLAKDEETATCE